LALVEPLDALCPFTQAGPNIPDLRVLRGHLIASMH
jgi:hypothetical protein